MRDYKKFNIWKIAHDITLDIYSLSKDFPDREKFGLTSQIRRASTSIALNIVEGSARKSEKEFSRFLYIAAGSAAETEYLILLLSDLEIIELDIADTYIEKIISLRKMIYKLIQKIQNT